ncbi:hypothetical protein SPBRAN_997 [uncultured Candidatus Thioglobus sp.]|nr:hypothetical protein SPBRAN_997 [uncultured Candidatus Thioglobus sp.]
MCYARGAPTWYNLNPALTLLGQGLRKSPIRQKLNFACASLFM